MVRGLGWGSFDEGMNVMFVILDKYGWDDDSLDGCGMDI
jgi:hypothetical protein